MNKILVTGGAGYIGSHTVLELLNNGNHVVVLDSLERGYMKALERIEQLSGKEIKFVQADLKNKEELKMALANLENIEVIVHFAAYKNVGEANEFPGKYYENNIQGTVNLLEAADKKGIK